VAGGPRRRSRRRASRARASGRTSSPSGRAKARFTGSRPGLFGAGVPPARRARSARCDGRFGCRQDCREGPACCSASHSRHVVESARSRNRGQTQIGHSQGSPSQPISASTSNGSSACSFSNSSSSGNAQRWPLEARHLVRPDGGRDRVREGIVPAPSAGIAAKCLPMAPPHYALDSPGISSRQVHALRPTVSVRVHRRCPPHRPSPPQMAHLPRDSSTLLDAAGASHRVVTTPCHGLPAWRRRIGGTALGVR
jgi:hypothetical protein